MRFILFFILAVIVIVFYPSSAFGSTYGSGTYGSGLYSVTSTPTPTPTSSGSSSSSGGGSSGGGGGCGDASPTSAPNLFQITRAKSSATLYYSPAGNPVNKYFIIYGPSENNFMHGFETSGSGNGVQTAVVNKLPNRGFVFKVRGGNGCASGAWSKALYIGTASRKYYPAPLPRIVNTIVYNVTRAIGNIKNNISGKKQSPVSKNQPKINIPKQEVIQKVNKVPVSQPKVETKQNWIQKIISIFTK
ncbi:MAG: hypothetical protein A3B44_02605 [Candidatus Levybacteria bacterium RIFCSPLOWO2_01_FULL_38_21]|nr:MAG: hypothetical protein A3B44_02605 [Candidatus Levybacteria bacterium RIFCSPLOWO2_01_FULL_38_21]